MSPFSQNVQSLFANMILIMRLSLSDSWFCLIKCNLKDAQLSMQGNEQTSKISFIFLTVVIRYCFGYAKKKLY